MQGLPGLTDDIRIKGVFKDLSKLADRFVGVAASSVNHESFAPSLSARVGAFLN
jgi:hypothetical protein